MRPALSDTSLYKQNIVKGNIQYKEEMRMSCISSFFLWERGILIGISRAMNWMTISRTQMEAVLVVILIVIH